MSDRPNRRIAPKGEKKMLAGVAARLGHEARIDPIIPRLAFVATFLFIEWEIALVAYIALGIYFTFFHGKAKGSRRDEQGDLPRRKSRRSGSVHDLRTKLDEKDRRMMAIDQHLNDARAQELDREIAELRTKVEAKKKAEAEAEKGEER